MSDYPFIHHLPAPLTQEEIADELSLLCKKLKQNMGKFAEQFPSACAQNNQYRIKGNDDWTNGFWTGMQAIAYEFTLDDDFLNGVRRNIASFEQRLKNHFILDHHDIGFLYSLSAGAYKEIMGNSDVDAMIVAAADVLLARFHQDAGFIQAWGNMGEVQEYRLIIDSLINLPLLFTASQLSGDDKYQQAAKQHFDHVIQNIFRDNYSSHHTYYFDPETKRPSHGRTFQGFSDASCWARGQAWAILGLPLNWRVGSIQPNEPLYERICDYFFAHLPEDAIPYWDLSFTAADQQSRDTSALAIVICGLLEAQRFFPHKNDMLLASQLLNALKQFASASHDKDCEGLLKHGVYAYSHNKGINECNLWGDYYYMEALYRLYNPSWKGYW
ncbi:glycoside hydrolase family 88 protein [Providencia manganoxydans]|uniref:glycoside hydrolase family 88 protein n=1 Tax=Providencia manganoxydans TaxID=2923283 RepID=UPI00280C5E50|nr:glycoside hydrolase family 88 protein [Providencia stuartii]ELR5081112.1 glycoside hydrolase family 88 protein [Providencia stuartii]